MFINAWFNCAPQNRQKVYFMASVESDSCYLCLQSVGPVVPFHPPESLEDDDDCYEEAEPFIPASQSTGQSSPAFSHKKTIYTVNMFTGILTSDSLSAIR